MKFKWSVVLLILFMLSELCLAQDTKTDDKESTKVKILKTKILIKNLDQPLREYALKHPYGLYPEASEEQEGNGTANLVEKLREGNYFIFNDTNLTAEKPYQLVDGWGNPMRYHPWKGKKSKKNAHNTKSYDLWSAGTDGKFDTDDDIVNWSVLLDEEGNKTESKKIIETNKKIKSTAKLIQDLDRPLNEYAYKHPYGKFPDTGDEQDGNGTSILVEKLSEGNFYKFAKENLTKEEPYQLVDAWGNPMRYHSWKGKKAKDSAHNKKGYDLWSAGADGEFDTADDVTNWSITLYSGGIMKDMQDIKKFFSTYVSAMNTFEAEKTLKFYYVPEEKFQEFKKNLNTQMTAMKKLYGEQEFMRDFEVTKYTFSDNTAKITYSCSFFNIENKNWSRSENTLYLVNIDGKWKIDVFEKFKPVTLEEMWAEAKYTLQLIIDAFEKFKKQSGNLDVLATDVWKPVSHILGAIKLNSDFLTGLKYFDLDDFKYITRKIDGVTYYRLICIGWGGETAGKTKEGPIFGWSMWDSEKQTFTDDYKSMSFDGLGKANVPETKEDSESKKSWESEIDDITKAEISTTIDGFFNAINDFNVEEILKYIYMKEDVAEKAVAHLINTFIALRESTKNNGGNYIKDWKIADLKVDGRIAKAKMKFFVFVEVDWEPETYTYRFCKIGDHWLVDFFEFVKEGDEIPVPENKKDEVPEEGVEELPTLNALIDEYYKSFNAYDAERIRQYIYIPEDKSDECDARLKMVLTEIKALNVPEKYTLFKDWVIAKINVGDEKADIRVDYKVFQDEENGYYEDSTEWLCVKVDGKWLVDMFWYSKSEMSTEDILKEALEKAVSENARLKAEIEKLKSENEKLCEKIEKYEKGEDKPESTKAEDKDAIAKLFTKFCEQVNNNNVEKIAEFVYIPEDKAENTKKELKEWVNGFVYNAGEKTDKYIKDWKVLDVEIDGNVAKVHVQIYFFFNGKWIKEDDVIRFVKIENRWLIDMFEYYEAESTDIPEEPDDEESMLEDFTREMFEVLNERNVEKFAKYVYIPEGKKAEYAKKLKEFIDVLIKQAGESDLPLVEDVEVAYIDFKDYGALITLKIIANFNGEYKEAEQKFAYISSGETWRVDLFGLYKEKEEAQDDSETQTQIKTLVDDFMKAMNAMNSEALLKLIYVDPEKKKEFEDEIADQFKKMKDQLGESEFVKSWKINKYKKVNAKVYNLEMTMNMYSKSGYKSEFQELRVVNHGNKWVVDLFYAFKSDEDTDKAPEYAAKSKITLAKVTIKMLYDAVQLYKLKTGNYPESLEQLISGPKDYKGKWHSLVVDENGFKDPWGNLYKLDKDEKGEIRIICYGADGKEGGKNADSDLVYPQKESNK